MSFGQIWQNYGMKEKSRWSTSLGRIPWRWMRMWQRLWSGRLRSGRSQTMNTPPPTGDNDDLVFGVEVDNNMTMNYVCVFLLLLIPDNVLDSSVTAGKWSLWSSCMTSTPTWSGCPSSMRSSTLPLGFISAPRWTYPLNIFNSQDEKEKSKIFQQFYPGGNSFRRGYHKNGRTCKRNGGKFYHKIFVSLWCLL